MENTFWHRSRFLKVALLSGLIHLLLCARYIRPEISPPEIPLYAWETLKKSKSFSFRYLLSKNSIKLNINQEGIFNTPDLTEVKGRWKQGEDEWKFHYIGAGNYQYEKKDKRWDVHHRGEETEIIKQIERIIMRSLRSKKFKLLDTNSVFIFSFEPNLAFLDPTFTKKFVGNLYVDKRKYTLKKIEAYSEDKDINFAFIIEDLNKAKKIKVPFVKLIRVVYKFEGNPKEVKEILRRRLEEAEMKAKIFTKGDYIVLEGDISLSEEKARFLSHKGDTKFVTLEPEGEDVSLKGEPTETYRIKETFLERKAIQKVELFIDELSRPEIRIFFNNEEKIPKNVKYIGVMIDSLLYDVTLIDKFKAPFRIKNIKTYEEAMLLKSIIAHPFPAKGLEFVRIEK